MENTQRRILGKKVLILIVFATKQSPLISIVFSQNWMLMFTAAEYTHGIHMYNSFLLYVLLFCFKYNISVQERSMYVVWQYM